MNKYLIISFAAVLCVACTHKPFVAEKVLNPVNPVVTNSCDTMNVTYQNDIQPILSANCYQCHCSAVTVDEGLNLERFSSLKSYLQYGFRGDGVFGSKFFHCISHSQNALPMPPTYTLDTCQLKKIKRWINLGAVEN